VWYTVLPLQGFEVTHPVFHDVANTDWLMALVHETHPLDVATEECGPATANNDNLLRQTSALIF